VIPAEVMAALAAHPDALRPVSEPDPGRAGGLQHVEFYPSGLVVVLYHWGRRTFRTSAELGVWLGGGIPESWQE